MPCFRGTLVGAVPSLGNTDVCEVGDWRQGPIWSTQQATDPYSPFLHAPTSIVDLVSHTVYTRSGLALGRVEHGGTASAVNTTMVYASTVDDTEVAVELVHPAVGIVGSSFASVPAVTTDGVVWRSVSFWRPLGHPELGVPSTTGKIVTGIHFADAIISMLLPLEVSEDASGTVAVLC